MIAEPDKMLAEKDPVATALFAKYKRVNMPNLRLNAIEVDAIVDYLKAQSADRETSTNR
jgi:protein SCO1/2